MSDRRSPHVVTLAHHVAAYVSKPQLLLKGLETMRSLALVPARPLCASNDLLVTAAFATPWTAALVLVMTGKASR